MIWKKKTQPFPFLFNLLLSFQLALFKGALSYCNRKNTLLAELPFKMICCSIKISLNKEHTMKKQPPPKKFQAWDIPVRLSIVYMQCSVVSKEIQCKFKLVGNFKGGPFFRWLYGLLLTQSTAVHCLASVPVVLSASSNWGRTIADHTLTVGLWISTSYSLL